MLRFTTLGLGAAALAVAGGCSDSVTEVSELPASVVTVSPASVQLPAGGSIRFDATVLTESGDTLPSAGVSWSSDDPAVATVDATGLATAVSEGTARITAAMADVEGSADIAVVGTGQDVVLFRESFDDTAFSGRGWYDNTSMTISAAEAFEGAGALEIHYGAGETLPSFGGAARRLFQPAETVHVAFWVKYSENWSGSSRPYHPHDFQILTNLDSEFTGPANTYLTAYIETNYQDGVRPVLGMRDRQNIDPANIGVDLTNVTEDRAVAGCNGEGDGYDTGCFQLGGSYWNEKFWLADEPAFTDAAGASYKGDWHYVEAYFALNSIEAGVGVPDGVAQYWVDGDLKLDLQGVLFRTGAHPDMRFNQFIIGPYIGDGAPVAQTMWVDELVVSRRP